MQEANYIARIGKERTTYLNAIRLHALPDIFHYWSNAWVRPKQEALGFSTDNDLFKNCLVEQCRLRPGDSKRFVSVGSGNCDLEIELAAHLESQGHRNFAIDCVDLNASMLERGAAAAEMRGVRERLHFIQADLNQWAPGDQYDAALANQSLHHVLELESLFGHIRAALKPDGCFVVSDIIGRNGHLRWPEALAIVQEFWPKLPPSYRFNLQLRRYEEHFEDWDCSQEAFEGIRSQDILPLLLDYFHFHLFFAFANVIEPFVDRSFGFHFDANAEWDRAFIDAVNRRDEEEITSGRIKPTHLIAVLRNRAAGQLIFHEPLDPQFCLRHPSKGSVVAISPAPYEWGAWPHSPECELRKACDMLRESEDRIRKLTEDLDGSYALIDKFHRELQRVNDMLEERTAWALELDRQVKNSAEEKLAIELEQRTRWALDLVKEVERLTALAGERTRWAQALAAENEQLAAELTRVNREFADRTEWTLDLDRDLKRLAWARRFSPVVEAARGLRQKIASWVSRVTEPRP